MIKNLFNKIKQNGITPELSLENKLNIEISNIFNALFIFLVFPFIIIFYKTPLASLLSGFPIIAFITSLVLVKHHQYKTGRLIFSVTTPTTIYFVAALLYNDSGTDGMAAKFLLIGDLMLPFIVFSKKEWRFIVPLLLITLFYLITFNYTNSLLNIPSVHKVDSPGLRMISILTVFVMFSIFFFSYKIILTDSLEKVDETNKKLMMKNKELTEHNAMKNKFFSIISHDIRGPMHSILGCAELLRLNNNQLDDKELKEFAESLYSTSKNTCQIVENLLSWSQSQMNGIELSIQKFELKNFVEETLSNYVDIAQAKNIQIINEIEDQTFVEADKYVAQCVLQNLITNAIKFSYPDGIISVSATKETKTGNNCVSVCVEDYGVGMNSQTLENLFQIGKAKSHPGTNNEKGTGLGLILSKEFAQMNGGDIYISSTPGKGSKVCFTLSLADDNFKNAGLKKEQVLDNA